MEKKYWSSDEYYFVDKATKENINYTGYVRVENGKAYIYETGDELFVKDNYQSKINLSDEYFDRILSDKLKLPHSKEECTFAANDYLKATVLNKIISNIEENNNFLFKNCIIAQNDFPLAEKIPCLSPYRELPDDPDVTTPSSNSKDMGKVGGWYWSNISYNYIDDIYDKTNWESDVIGQDWFTDTIFDAVAVGTDKFYDNPETLGIDPNDIANDKDKLFAVFLASPTNVRLINLYLYPTDKLSTGNDPMQAGLNTGEGTVQENYDKVIKEREFKQYSPVNNQQYTDNPEKIPNLKVRIIDHADPSDDKSFVFQNISGIAQDGSNFYIIDKTLNAIFKYNISRCLSDRGAATNKIILEDYLHGKGTLTEPYFFNGPTSVSAFDNVVAVLDTGNKCVKVFDNYFNHKFTIKHGAFFRQEPKAVAICPYEFIYNNVTIEKGAIFVLSEVGKKISIDFYTKDAQHLGSKTITDLELIKEIYIDEKTGAQSSPTNPVTTTEYVKKIVFSYNNSNFFYITTSKRTIKLQLSKPSEPIGIISYSYKAVTDDELIWQSTDKPWDAVLDGYNNYAVWSYNRSGAILSYPDNKCFTVTGLPGIETDIIFNILDNRIYYGNGSVHRFDNPIDKKYLYQTKDGTLTYDIINGTSYNKPVYAKTLTEVQGYYDKDGVLTEITDESPEEYKPYKKFVIEETVVLAPKMSNCILFYKEPNIFRTSLLKTDLKLYSSDDLYFRNNQEYFDQLTFNKLLYKLFFNLQEIKKYIYGTFVAGYSLDNIMVYDHVETDASIINEAPNQEDFMIGENENTSIILNRCFLNIYNIQLNICKKIQTKYLSSINYNTNNYQII